MAGLRVLSSTLLAIGALANAPVEDELPAALHGDDACAAEGCGLELRQLRGERAEARITEEEPTCGDWLQRNECDEESEIAVDASTTCDDECSQDVCCESRASCSFYTAMGSCAKLAVPENVTKMVWATKESDEFETFCATAKQDEESCGKACCELKPCKKCSGETYTSGCQAGSVGECTACPTESSCEAGHYQLCGEGVLGSCKKCSNAPENAHYKASAMSEECPWECDDDYTKVDGKCVASVCRAWTGKCDAASEVALKSATSCDGPCSQSTCCTTKATCSSFLGTAAAATCALVKDAAADGKVWAPLEATGSETLYCKGAENDTASCEKACCSEQSCTACTGETYTKGCVPGSVGACAACPTKSTCDKGEYQTCGDGVLSECKKCTNGPVGEKYLSNAMGNACVWECDEGYAKATVNGEATCKASCSLYKCSAEKHLVSVPRANTTYQKEGETNQDQVCCQSAGCEKVSGKEAVSEEQLQTGGCKVFKNSTECEAKYVVSGNQKKDGKGATLYTACVWDAGSEACNWDQAQYRNCVI
eukprot:gb/GFBE01043998.1/.p1 GENE.gb/GFBE01043998.1/~~gb/GFBE01043998.1/.p1  ORF type:complete len:540 (+),score=148.06 gb/GFBE01043998.1/:1-1620(+)